MLTKPFVIKEEMNQKNSYCKLLIDGEEGILINQLEISQTRGIQKTYARDNIFLNESDKIKTSIKFKSYKSIDLYARYGKNISLVFYTYFPNEDIFKVENNSLKGITDISALYSGFNNNYSVVINCQDFNKTDVYWLKRLINLPLS